MIVTVLVKLSRHGPAAGCGGGSPAGQLASYMKSFLKLTGNRVIRYTKQSKPQELD